ILQSHLANECTDCPEEIQNYWLRFIAAKDSLDDDDSASIASSTDSNKKRKVASNENYQKAKQQQLINIQAFVCCEIPFAVIDSSFFRELLYQLRSNYTPPTRK
ncbi:5207_t:CDS:2, partial [Rhizophagus irregularis]